jgi:hypothetical protein
MRRASQLFALSLAAVLDPVAKASLAAVTSVIPPPGLYRVEVDSNSDLGKGAIRTHAHVDGTSGDSTGTTILANGDTQETHLKGRSPATECIRPDTAPLGVLSLPRNCTQLSTTATPDGGIHTAACPSGKFRMTVKKVGKDVWEIVSETEQALGLGPANMSFMRPILEREARSAAREEDRKKAAKSLADLDRLDKQMAASRAESQKIMSDVQAQASRRPETGAPLPPLSQSIGSRTLTVRVRKVMKRISESCPGPR